MGRYSLEPVVSEMGATLAEYGYRFDPKLRKLETSGNGTFFFPAKCSADECMNFIERLIDMHSLSKEESYHEVESEA